MVQHFYGYLHDKPDSRDFLYTVTAPETYPNYIDLRNYCSPVRDQGQLGSCTAFSMATGLKEFQTLVQGKYKTKFSPLDLYYNERVIEGTVNEDSGAEIRDGLKVLNKQGVCQESYWPYKISKFTVKPSKKAITNESVKSHKINSYTRISDLNGIKSALNKKQGIVLGFTVYESFENIGSDGKMPEPKNGEQILGGHAVFCCGYKDDPTWKGGGYLIIKNSWGTSWGAAGFFFMSYQYAQNSDYVSDIWTAN
jgi:C1A family cysteine protease